MLSMPSQAGKGDLPTAPHCYSDSERLCDMLKERWAIRGPGSIHLPCWGPGSHRTRAWMTRENVVSAQDWLPESGAGLSRATGRGAKGRGRLSGLQAWSSTWSVYLPACPTQFGCYPRGRAPSLKWPALFLFPRSSMAFCTSG